MATTNQTPEEQIVDLQKTVQTQETALKGKDKTIEQLTTAGKTKDQTIEELKATGRENQTKAQKDLSEKVGRIRELEQEAEVNNKLITTYENQAKLAKIAAQGGAIVVEHEGKHYRVRVPQFHFEGKLVQAETLTDNAELVGKLVTAGSGVLELAESQD